MKTEPNSSDWRRLPRNGEKLAGLSRPTIYRLMNQGIVKGKRVHLPGSKKSITFVDRNSIAQMIDEAQDV